MCTFQEYIILLDFKTLSTQVNDTKSPQNCKIKCTKKMIQCTNINSKNEKT